MNINPVFHQDNNRLLHEKSLIIASQKNPENFGPLYRIYHESIYIDTFVTGLIVSIKQGYNFDGFYESIIKY